MEDRIQKLMSQAGIASRRASELMITQGRVTINGEVATLGQKADPAKDVIRVDGARLQINADRIYIMLNKPTGVVTTTRAQSQDERRTVRDLVPGHDFLYPVGRLDADSEGLILLTNDGELAEKLTHPRYEHPKVYEVALYGNAPDKIFETWRRGIVLEDGPTKPVELKVLSRDKDLTWVRIAMQEGRKRQIRRIAKLLGHPVRQLIRTEFGTLKLDDLKIGQWRYLTPDEIQTLQKSVGNVPRRQSPRRRTVASHLPTDQPSSDRQRKAAPARSPTRSSARPSSRRPASSTRSGGTTNRTPGQSRRPSTRRPGQSSSKPTSRRSIRRRDER